MAAEFMKSKGNVIEDDASSCNGGQQEDKPITRVNSSNSEVAPFKHKIFGQRRLSNNNSAE